MSAAPVSSPLRVAYVTETYPPEINGVSLTAARAVEHLREAGHTVQLVRPQQRGEPRVRNEALWLSAGGPIPMYPALRWGAARPATLRGLWQGAARPDVVHVATPGPLGHAALVAARAEGLPATADFRTNFHAYSRYYHLGWLEPAVLAWLRRLHGMAALNFVPAPLLARALARQGFERLQVLGRGVDAQRFSPQWRDPWLRGRWRAHRRSRVLLVVGRLAAEKNVDWALHAFERLRRQHAGLRMVVVGDGPARAALQQAHPQVRFVGERTGEDLARHYASADVFLFPSLTDTFGNVTLEALASGLAVAAFDTAAAGLHVRDGVSGCLARCAPGADAAALREAFVEAASRALAASDPDGPLRRAARAAACAADWPRVLRGFEQALQRVAATRPETVRHAALA